MTWRDRCAEIIQEATKDLPEDLRLADRIRAVDGARPSWYHGASWPKKAWQAARRDYLTRFGYEPKTKKAAQRKRFVIAELPLFATNNKEGLVTKSQREALEWLGRHGGDACFDKHGVALAMGESAPFTRTTWNSLRNLGLVEMYNPSGRGRGRMRLTQKGGD